MAKTYKALILDLDGTTVRLGYNNLPTEKVKQAVQKLRGKIPVCIATGRTWKDASGAIEALGGVDLCILNNGAALYEIAQNTFLDAHCLAQDVVQQVIGHCSFLGERLFFSTLQGELTLKEKDQAVDVTGFFLTKLTQDEVLDFQKIFEGVKDIGYRVESQTFDGLPVIVLFHPLATKKLALEHVFQRFQVKAEEVVAVGDGENDVPMILAAGMGVAMGNAADGVKSIADYIAPTVDEDGVAHVIEKFFLVT